MGATPGVPDLPIIYDLSSGESVAGWCERCNRAGWFTALLMDSGMNRHVEMVKGQVRTTYYAACHKRLLGHCSFCHWMEVLADFGAPTERTINHAELSQWRELTERANAVRSSHNVHPVRCVK